VASARRARRVTDALSFLESRTEPEPNSGCWLWMMSSGAGKPGSRYGDFRYKNQHISAHRFSYERLVGPIPLGYSVLHRCDVSLCCNPAHLFVGTNTDNINDSVSKGRRKGVKRPRPSGLVYRPQSIASRLARMKLSPDTRLEIRTRAASGQSWSALAREYGVSWATVRRAINEPS
jgi:HNH endonuclease